MYSMINIINAAVLYMKVVKKVNSKSSHPKKKIFSIFKFCIYMRRWMFTKLTEIITS